MHTIQAALKQPLEPAEWKEITDYSQNRFQATAQTILTTAQVQDILNQVFLKRAERLPGSIETRNIQPIFIPLFAPFSEPFKALSARPGLALIALIVVMILLWMVI